MIEDAIQQLIWIQEDDSSGGDAQALVTEALSQLYLVQYRIERALETNDIETIKTVIGIEDEA